MGVMRDTGQSGPRSCFSEGGRWDVGSRLSGARASSRANNGDHKRYSERAATSQRVAEDVPKYAGAIV